ncbi:SGNH/GDSL hydrolase family protein [Bradyrhizobium guangdongense]|uniref:SGNH/GDSL hydrolase family protein n=1 Tax=Bradyrhizobium guangdongense TaxID=1325090 RepID=UPI00131A1BCC|nr:SGNH/GDSL hydrolase family protein [Bradyrhizobium guangdongense]
MAQQNLNDGLLPEQLRLAGQANFVELFSLLNTAYALDLSPINLNVGLSPSQIVTAARQNFSQIYAALNQQGVSISPRYLNAGLTQDQLIAAAQANFTDLYATLTGTNGAPMPASVASLTALGDSMTADANASDQAHGFVSLVAGALGASGDVVRKGLGGTVLQNSIFSGGAAQTGNFRDRYVADTLGSNRREMLIIVGGTNDARYTAAPATMTPAGYTKSGLEIVNGAVAAGYARDRIVFCGPAWITDAGLATGTGGFSGQTREGYEAHVAAAESVARATGVYWGNLYRYMRDHGGDALIGSDNIHPENPGHAIMAQGILASRQFPISGSKIFLDDTFTDADNTLITNHTPESGLAYYTQPAFSASPHCSVINNRLVGTSASGVYFNNQAARFGADYYVEAKLDFLSTIAGENVGITARAAPNAQTFYVARWGQSSSSFALFKSVAGTLTQLGSSYVTTFTSGSKVLRLTCQGSTISVAVDGTTVISVTDTDISLQGFAGVRFLALQTESTGIHVDRLTAANL